MTDSERIVEIEAKLSLAEDLLDTLNMTVFRQQEALARLERQVTELRRQIANMSAPGAAGQAADEVPPHY